MSGGLERFPLTIFFANFIFNGKYNLLGGSRPSCFTPAGRFKNKIKNKIMIMSKNWFLDLRTRDPEDHSELY